MVTPTNHLYRNVGAGRFEDVCATEWRARGAAPSARATSTTTFPRPVCDLTGARTRSIGTTERGFTDTAAEAGVQGNGKD
jgi:hypothetical protein